MPVFRAVTIIPIASEEAETTAIAASLLTFARSVMRSRKKAAIATIGMENFSGAQPNASATDKAPNHRESLQNQTHPQEGGTEGNENPDQQGTPDKGKRKHIDEKRHIIFLPVWMLRHGGKLRQYHRCMFFVQGARCVWRNRLPVPRHA